MGRSGRTRAVVPNLFGTGTGFMEDGFSIDRAGGGFRMIQTHTFTMLFISVITSAPPLIIRH